MRRVACIVATTALVTGLVVAAAVVQFGDDAFQTGRGLYPYRDEVLPTLDTADARMDRPDVVWLGDSSILPVPGFPSYAGLIDHEPLRRRRERSVRVVTAGLDFFGYYTLMGRVLDLEPRLVVMVANFLSLGDASKERTFNDLIAQVPADELPVLLLQLPFGFRGLTLPAVLLARAFDTPDDEATRYLYEGLRHQVREAAVWEALGPTELPASFEKKIRAIRRKIGVYTRPVTASHPLVRFAAGATRMATRRGVRVLVIVTPIPMTVIGQTVDPETFTERVEVIRRAVGAAGGTVLDLHGAMPATEFRDLGTHLTGVGARHMANMVWPAMRELLDDSPRPTPLPPRQKWLDSRRTSGGTSPK